MTSTNPSSSNTLAPGQHPNTRHVCPRHAPAIPTAPNTAQRIRNSFQPPVGSAEARAQGMIATFAAFGSSQSTPTTHPTPAAQATAPPNYTWPQHNGENWGISVQHAYNTPPNP